MKTKEIEQLPEHCEQAEWFLMSCLIDKPDILPALDEDLFYVSGCQAVYRAIVYLKFKGVQIDWQRVGMKLQKDHGPELFEKMATEHNQLPSPWSYSYWLDICQEFRTARRTAALGVEMHEASKLVGTGLTPNHADLSSKLKSIVDGSAVHGPRTAKDILPSVVDHLQQAFNDPRSLYGICTPFEKLDELTYGFQPGSLNIIAARPGIGKTAIACNIAACAAFAGHGTAFFSLEMSEKSIISRMLAAESGVPMSYFLNHSASKGDFQQVTSATVKLSKSPLLVYDAVSDIADIHREATAAVAQRGVKFVVVDYLQRVQMRACRDGHFATVGNVSNALKDLAMELKIPVLALAQISRDVEKDKRMPVLSDLKDSGQIEQDADVIGFLHVKEKGSAGEVLLLIANNRNGSVGSVDLIFDKSLTRFKAADRVSAEDVPSHHNS